MIIGFCFTTKEDTEDDSFMNRNQTDEWKGKQFGRFKCEQMTRLFVQYYFACYNNEKMPK